MRQCSEAVVDGLFEGAARWTGFRRGPVHACETRAGVPAVGVFAVLNYDAGVQEGGAEGPEEGADFGGLGKKL